jgi:uncharacterized membrane protein YkoI
MDDGMMIKHFSIALLWVALALSALLYADEEESYREARHLTRIGEILPLQEILKSIQSERRGRVLEVELERKGPRYVYEIEILDEQGVVWEYKVDAVNGQIVNSELED